MSRLCGLEKGRAGLERVVEIAYRHLGLDLVYVAELRGGRQVFRATAGDVTSFHFGAGGPPAESTYCRRLADGAIPNLIRDARADTRVAHLPITRTAGIGAYIGVPLRLADGSLYGTFCGLSHGADPSLDDRDVRFMSMLAELFLPELDEQRRRERLQVDVAGLIESQEVDIAYQPIFDLRSRRCLGVEGLARFPQPYHRPDKTFAAAYEVGLGFDLERLVLRRAWPLLETLGGSEFVTLNLTPGALLKLAPRAAGRTGLPLRNLVVEMTEHSVVRSYTALREELVPLRERGLRIAIDDAGAGYASLRHIVELEPDFIKVDRSLVHGVADDHARRVALSAFVMLSLDLGATVIAEGIERRRDVEVLSEIGVDAAQGYLLGRPSADPDDVARWLDLPAPDLCPRLTSAGSTGAT